MENKPIAWLNDNDELYFDRQDAIKYSNGFVQPLYTLQPTIVEKAKNAIMCMQRMLYSGEWYAAEKIIKELEDSIQTDVFYTPPKREWRGLSISEWKKLANYKMVRDKYGDEVASYLFSFTIQENVFWRFMS